MSTRAIRLRRWSYVLAAAFALYIIVGFLVLPPIVRSQIATRASAALDREVTIERVRINPLSCVIAIHGVRVADHDGGDLASWREIYINADPVWSLLRLQWHLAEFRLVEPRKRLVIDEQGRLNVADLIERYAPPADAPPRAPSRPPAAGIDRLRVERAAIEVIDRSRRTPFRTVLGPMTFAIEGFTTRADAASPYTFAGTTDTGESFTWSGDLSVAPPGSRGRIAFTGFSIPKHMPLAEHLFAGAVRSGKVSFSGNYILSLAPGPVVALEDAVFAIDDLSVGERTNPDPLLRLGRLQVDITRADALQRTADIAKVGVQGLALYVTREPDGTIDLLRLATAAMPAAETPTAPASAPQASGDPGPAPSVSVALIEVSGSRISVIDRSQSRTARVVLDDLHFTATGAGTDLDREVAVQMSARWNEAGALAARGTVRALPLAAQLEVKGERLDLAPLDPLLEPFADARVKSGEAWFAGAIEAAAAPGGALGLTWRGDAGLDALAVRDGRGQADLVSWKRLALTGTEVHLDPFSVAAREVALVEPVATIEMDEDGAINLLAVLKAAPASAEPTPAPPPSPAAPAARTSERVAAATQRGLGFDARIDTVTLSDARIQIADRSFRPGFSAALLDFGGTIRGLSSASVARADVDLSGTIDGVAPLRISGRINPLAEDVYSDIQIVLGNVDLPMFSPYSGRFIGQKIQKGKLRLDLGYKVSQREIHGRNTIVLDQFYLGERVESPEALKLPVGLALKLMRDREGRILLDPEVRGNLDDPDFSYARIVWRTLGNIFVKAMTSPFGFLGSLVPGGGSVDLNQVDFASGSAGLTDDARRKIELLAAALHERPELNLEIGTPPSPTTDRAGLVEAKFARLLAAEKHRLALAALPEGGSEPALEPVTASEVDALVASLYAATHPDEAAAAGAAALAAGVQPVAVHEPEATEEPGVVRRPLRRIFGGGAREPAAAPPPAPTEGAQDVDTPGLTLEGMRERLVAAIEIGEDDLRELGRARAAAIREALLADGRVAAERIYVLDTATVPEGASGPTEGGRVFFGLR